MGYEIKFLIGKTSSVEMAECEKDLSKPYSDGSGFPNKKDAQGNDIKTGRTSKYFSTMATIDLCKLGYQKDALNDLISDTHAKGREAAKTQVIYCYGLDENKEITEDPYGDPLYPAPIKEVLAASHAALAASEGYRRLFWAVSLLNAMQDDPEELEVIFYGH